MGVAAGSLPPVRARPNQQPCPAGSHSEDRTAHLPATVGIERRLHQTCVGNGVADATQKAAEVGCALGRPGGGPSKKGTRFCPLPDRSASDVPGVFHAATGAPLDASNPLGVAASHHPARHGRRFDQGCCRDPEPDDCGEVGRGVHRAKRPSPIAIAIPGRTKRRLTLLNNKRGGEDRGATAVGALYPGVPSTRCRRRWRIRAPQIRVDMQGSRPQRGGNCGGRGEPELYRGR